MTGSQPSNDEYAGLSDDAEQNCLLVGNAGGTTSVVAKSSGETTEIETDHGLTDFRSFRIDWTVGDSEGAAHATVLLGNEVIARLDSEDGDAVPAERMFFAVIQRTDAEDAPPESAKTLLRDGPRVY